MDPSYRFMRVQLRRDQFGGPESQNMAVATLDFLSDDDVDSEAVCEGRRFECTFVGVVVANGDHGQVRGLRGPLQQLLGISGPVGRGGMYV
jgi:hypothetical protein